MLILLFTTDTQACSVSCWRSALAFWRSWHTLPPWQKVHVRINEAHLHWLLEIGGFSAQPLRYGVLLNPLFCPDDGSVNAPYLQPPVNWPEKCTVKAPRVQWGSSWVSTEPQPGSCLMNECEGRAPYGEPGWKSTIGPHWGAPLLGPGRCGRVGTAGMRGVRSRTSDPISPHDLMRI